MQLFLNDITKHQVSIEKSNGEQLIKGLPIMRVGEWNGIDYDADDLQDMAGNFERIRDEDGVEPALKSRHTYDPETGKPQNVDAAETTQGWVTGMHYDEDTEALLADVRPVDESLIPDIDAGKLRYLSAEISSDKEVVGVAWVHDPAMRGMPWELVMNSREYGRGQVATHAMGSLSASELDTRLRDALREMDVYEDDSEWDGPYLHQVFEDHLIVEHNGQCYRHDYSVDDTEVSVESEREEVKQAWVAVNAAGTGEQQRRTAESAEQAQRTQRTATAAKGERRSPGNTRALRNALVAIIGQRKQKGGTTMKERAKAFLANVLSGKATDKDVDEFVESLPEGDAPEGGGEEAGEPGEGDSGLELQMAQYRKQNAELQQRVQTVEANARREKVAAQVEGLVSGRHLPPDLRQHAAVLLDVLGQQTNKVKLLSKDEESGKETTTDHDPARLLVQMLEGIPTAMNMDEMGLTYLVDEGTFGEGEDIEAQKSAGENLAKEMNERAAVGEGGE